MRNNQDDNENYIGMAGIAGGSINPPVGQSFNEGVSLFGLNITTATDAINAIYKASRGWSEQNPDPLVSDGHGFEVNVINMSMGFNTGEILTPIAPVDDPVPPSIAQEFWYALRFAYRSGVIFCASRGNADDCPSPLGSCGHAPATTQDEFVTNVTGCGINAKYQTSCLVGGDIDISAPSDGAFNLSTNNTNNPAEAYYGLGYTSGAAPHAAGVAALLAAYMESAPSGAIVLSQDDFEYIVQNSAKDIDLAPAGSGLDTKTGYGLLQADKAALMIFEPECRLQHLEGTNTTQTLVPDWTGIPILLYKDIKLDDGTVLTGLQPNGSPVEGYFADRYAVEINASHTLPVGHGLQHFWVRHGATTTGAEAIVASTNGIAYLHETMEYGYFIDPPSNTEAHLMGYLYHIWSNIPGLEADGWWPSTPENATIAYSVISCISDGAEDIVINNNLKVFPNPSDDAITLVCENLAHPDQVFFIHVVDISGKVLMRQPIKGADLSAFSLNISELPNGMYACAVTGDQFSVSTRFIKHD